MIDFNGSTLYISLRSPFARRVRLAFLEHDISFEEKVIDVFNPPPNFEKINPLQRIPVLFLRTGQPVIDSNAILSLFYSQRKSPLWPASEEPVCFEYSGLGLGLCELLVQRYIETLRPKDKQDETFLEDAKKMFSTLLDRFEEYISGRDFIGSRLTQADLDMGTGLAYVALRYNDHWSERYPNIAKYFKKLDERPSFQATRPPPA